MFVTNRGKGEVEFCNLVILFVDRQEPKVLEGRQGIPEPCVDHLFGFRGLLERHTEALLQLGDRRCFPDHLEHVVEEGGVVSIEGRLATPYRSTSRLPLSAAVTATVALRHRDSLENRATVHQHQLAARDVFAELQDL